MRTPAYDPLRRKLVGGTAATLLARPISLFERAAPGADADGLILGRPSDAGTLAAVATRNADTVGAAIRLAIRRGAKRIVLPAADLVLGAQTTPGYAGRPSLYIAGTEDFFVHLDDTNVWIAGVDRTDIVGLAMWEGCRGTCGFSGSGSVDYVNPQFTQGIVKKIVDPGRFVVTLDERIAWLDTVSCVVYDPVRDCYASRPFYARQASADQPNIPIVRQPGEAHDYLVDCTTPACAAFEGDQIAPGVELVFMHFNRENLVAGVDTDKIVMPRGLRIHAAPNAVFYGQNCSLDFDAHVEARLMTSATPSRGRFRRRMCASGGLLFTPSELSSSIGGTIIGVGDDAVDFADHVSAVVTRDGDRALTIALAANRGTAPRAGQRVTLTDAGRVKRFESVVEAVRAGGTTAALSFPAGATLPSDVGAGWEVENAAPNRGVVVKDECRIELTASAGIRGSAQEIRIGDCFLAETMGPALMIADAGATEFAPASTITVGRLGLRNPNCGLGFERLAAVTIRPRLKDGGTLAAIGAFGTVDIAAIEIVGSCEGPALAAGAIASLRVGSLHAQAVNAHPTAFGGLPTGAAVQLENIAVARFGTIDVDGPRKATVACRSVGRLVLSPSCRVFTPIAGVGMLEVEALADPHTGRPK